MIRIPKLHVVGFLLAELSFCRFYEFGEFADFLGLICALRGGFVPDFDCCRNTTETSLQVVLCFPVVCSELSK